MKKAILAVMVAATLSGNVYAGNGNDDDSMHEVNYDPSNGNFYYELDGDNNNGKDDEYILIGVAGGTTNNYGDITGSVNNSCGASVAHGSTVNCTTNIESATIDVSTLTDDQLSKLKGETGATGAEGKDGKDGKDGVDGKDGLDGKDGEKGDKGETGAAGKDGVDGTNGVDGKDGLNGKDGVDGVDGKDGQDGKDGITTIINEYDKDQVDADFATDEDLEKLKDRIEEVNVEDQRVESGKLDKNGNLILTNADMDGDSKNDVTIDLSGLDQSEEVQANTDTIDSVNERVDFIEHTNNNQQVEIDQAHDRIDAIQDTLYEEGVIRAESDKILSEAIETARDESVNGDKYLQDQVNVINEKNDSQDQVIADLEDSKVNKDVYEADQKRQDQVIADLDSKVDSNQTEMYEHVDSVKNEINETITQVNNNVDRVESESKVRDDQLQSNIDTVETQVHNRIDGEVAKLEGEIELGDKKTLESANTYTDVKVSHEVEQRKAADVQLASQISNEALIRAEQDALTLAEAQLYTDTGIQRQALKQAKVDQAQDARITKNEQKIAGLQQDVAELNGIVAGTLAASTFEMPMDWNGDWAIQAGIGGYKGANALALGVVTAGEGYAIRATVTGSDADDFSELAYGASVTISTKLFD
ncbi:putative coil containing protein [Vibrio phage 501E54-1]|nr:putative coil containing protein [Vibrio phage 501E54-1]